MNDTTKYLIHANITAAGVVERNDVVGAVFGQTEGLLGEEMDLRTLQDAKKVGRIDVEIQSKAGQTFGEITIASGLDRVETATLAAALETIEQVGPCRAEIEVSNIEDVRSAKRREVVERATEILSEFEAESMGVEDIVETVRQQARVADISEYEGLPAGPRVADSDAIVVVEGRADVLQLLKYGVKNAIAVEGTDVPESVADLTSERTVTAFLDGDRGGDLILKELSQVGDVDFVAVAPRDRSVEDLSRGEVMAALRDKIPYETVADAESPAHALADRDREAARTDGSTAVEHAPDAADDEGATAIAAGESGTETTVAEADAESTAERDAETATDAAEPTTLSDHVAAVIQRGSDTVRLLDADGQLLDEGPAADAVSLVGECEQRPSTVVLDGECTQKVVDVAAQRGVDVVVAARDGEYVKQPTSVQVRIAD
ncbi:DNA primase DnaG [Halomicroarcula sp. GCM10025817]|uniref:DNA primase DnaG n=1 Tax=Haloarcula TaxID=2237 RepID=UPI0023E8202C|nr:DNA primase DnaG [Halomicroarcula sp. SYNS111]